jgi:hypothetical protein
MLTLDPWYFIWLNNIEPSKDGAFDYARIAMSELDELGLVTSASRSTTTFSNNGLMLLGDPLREAWSHIEPTIMGLVAALARRMRDPYFMWDLQQRLTNQSTIAEYLLDWASTQLALIYGDSPTVVSVQRKVDVDRRSPHRRSNYPAWFRRVANGARPEYSLNMLELAQEHAFATITTMARAHAAVRVVNDSDTPRYCVSYLKTLAPLPTSLLWQHEPPSSLTALSDLDAARTDVNLMNAHGVIASGARDALLELLASNLSPRVSLSDYAYIVGGFMRREDREVFELPWSFKEEDKFTAWCESYQQSLTPPRFAVSRRGAK